MPNLVIRHALSYFIARGIPGLVNFAALAVYTRLLTTHEFGRYAVVLSFVGLAHVLAFQAVQLVATRFIPSRSSNQRLTQGHVEFMFFCLAAAVIVCGLASLAWFVPPGWEWLVAFGLLVVLAQGWHELNLNVSAILLQPRIYGFLSATKAVVALALGALLAWVGLGADAPLIGLACGMGVASLLYGSHYWRHVRPHAPSKTELKAYLNYGLPLSVTFVLLWVVSSSDRIMISRFLGDTATGVYASGYDLAQNSLGLILAIINTAATPLAINALEKHGIQAARKQLADNGELIFTFALAGAAGLIGLASPAVNLFIGEDFRSGAIMVFPWIAVSAAIVGVKAFYFDIAFHISKSSKWLIVTSGIAAVFNLVGNYFLIPQYGIIGAAWSAILAFTVAALSSHVIGKHVFPMPNCLPMIVKALIIGALVYGAIVASMAVANNVIVQILLALTFGGIVFVFGAWVADVGHMRMLVKQSWNRAK